MPELRSRWADWQPGGAWDRAGRSDLEASEEGSTLLSGSVSPPLSHFSELSPAGKGNSEHLPNTALTEPDESHNVPCPAARGRTNELVHGADSGAADYPSGHFAHIVVPEAPPPLGAVLINSPRFGEVWVAFTTEMAKELQDDEGRREAPRPVLTPHDIERLQGRSPEAIRAFLTVAAVFPGAEICDG